MKHFKTTIGRNTGQFNVLSPHLFSRPAPAADTQTAAALCCSSLLVCLRLLVVLTDLEVTQLVRLLVRRHHSQPVTEVVLLQVLLSQILQIPFGELLLRRDVDLVLHAADLDDVTEVPRLPVDLYPLFEEGFKVGRVQDPVLHRVGQVQGELPSSSLLGLLADCRPLLFDLSGKNSRNNIRAGKAGDCLGPLTKRNPDG